MDDVFEDLTDRPAAFTRALEVCATKRIDNAQQFIAREAYGFLRSCEVRMTCPYHSDLAASQEAIRLARDELLRVIDSLGRADFERARKGGWPVRKVLEHVIHSEKLYAQATA